MKKGPFRGARYRDTGRGLPVVLLHGFPVDGSLWDGVVPGLQKQYRLLIPDLPGSGSSPLSGDVSMENLAAFLSDLLVQESIDRCILIGHSMGGYITLAFAEYFPDKLLGFGLFHSTAFADTQEKKEGRRRSIELIKQYGADAFLRQMMPTLFSRDYRKNHTGEMLRIIRGKEPANGEALIAYYRAMMARPDRTPVLQQTRVPVLFVIGKEDTAAPERDLLRQVSLPPVSDIQLIPDTAHLAMLEKPLLSEEVLKGFIQLCQSLNPKK